jgi:putative membrane protein insertion efficiency factor
MRQRLSMLLWSLGWPARQLLLLPIRGYRVSIGKVVGGRCRFYPSCSEYAAQAIARTGAVRGVILTAWRLLRCSPLSVGGIDHPPAGRWWSQRETRAGRHDGPSGGIATPKGTEVAA